MNAIDKVIAKNNEGKFICVGLDTDLNKLPKHYEPTTASILDFNKRIIEATSDLAAAYKVNFAFYEKFGSSGFDLISETISCIPEKVLTIADAKRGDIGNTSEMYASAIFDHFGFDSITVSPYMGTDSITPFLKYDDKIIFILALTSNPGASDFEKQKLADGSFLFQKVISKISEWNTRNNCGLVFGATQSKDLEQNIKSFEDMPVLLPGVGAQGGSLEDVVRIFKDAGRTKLLVNVSRGLLYRSNGPDFAESARLELENLNKIASGYL